ncbi:MAG: hypothetical protein HOC93_09265 [Phycisphaerae bacterium]|jgi:hypothetical protein|nr:hypothetical protein [Phycisphaerae bacterium]|tara:strand:+ start:3479 stop:4300 length:822 start_codon:yes stop_codon:yes gene_type:complete
MSKPTEKPCGNCGYDLRGLPAGRPCPECGETGMSSYSGAPQLSGVKDLSLSQMPEHLVRRIAFCCAVLFLAVALIVARIFVPAMNINVLVDVVVSILWVLSVYFITNPMTDTEAVWRGLGKNGRVRIIARWATTASILFAVSLGVPQANPLYPIALFITVVFGIVSVAGMLCLFGVLSQLAQWCRDSSARRCLDTAAWGSPMIFIVVEPLRLTPISPAVVFVGELIGAVFIMCGPIGMAMLMSSSLKAVGHAREYQEYLERRTQDRTQWPSPE